MKILKNEGSTVYQLKKNIVLIKPIAKSKKNFKTLLHFWKLYVRVHTRKYWFVILRTPVFFFEKNNGGVSIGFPNFYLWLIR